MPRGVSARSCENTGTSTSCRCGSSGGYRGAGGGVEGRGGVVGSHARDRCSERVGLGCLRPATACLRARLQRFLRYPLQTIMSW